MTELIQLLASLGKASIGSFWFPVCIWTLCSGIGMILLWKCREISSSHHFQIRSALLVALPLGLVGSALMQWASTLWSSQAVSNLKLIVIQNPLSVTPAGNSAAAIEWSSSHLWLGLLLLIITIGSLITIALFLWNVLQLRRLTHQLEFQSISTLVTDPTCHSDVGKTAKVAFAEVEVPFTYGLFQSYIVLPDSLKAAGSDTTMAVKHELAHIKRHDFFLNSIFSLIRSLFWFHPLIHRLFNSCREYREITCDNEVLSDPQVSRKKYAQLLYTLAFKSHNRNQATISMAVNSSTLKRRIKMMKNPPTTLLSHRKSVLLLGLIIFSMIGMMSCSDLQNDGITNSEVKEVQSNIQTQPSASEPLYIVNGESLADKGITRKELSQLKSKYIKAVNVLKGEKAIEEYGHAGKNGVIIMRVLNEEKAFNDLQDASSSPTPSQQTKDFFVAAEKMPELKGGLGALQQKIQYPEEARKAGDEGRVIVQFIVNEQGQVEDPQIIKGVSQSLDQEALRVVKQAEFKPGMQKGQPVRVQYSLPITYRL